jgi:hypothetical protein
MVKLWLINCNLRHFCRILIMSAGFAYIAPETPVVIIVVYHQDGMDDAGDPKKDGKDNIQHKRTHPPGGEDCDRRANKT